MFRPGLTWKDTHHIFMPEMCQSSCFNAMNTDPPNCQTQRARYISFLFVMALEDCYRPRCECCDIYHALCIFDSQCMTHRQELHTFGKLNVEHSGSFKKYSSLKKSRDWLVDTLWKQTRK